MSNKKTKSEKVAAPKTKKAPAKSELEILEELKQDWRKERRLTPRREKLAKYTEMRDRVLGRKSKAERVKEAWQAKK